MQHDFILLDRSSSMGSRWAEAVNSVNAYVHTLAKEKVDTGVTLAVFDTSPKDGRLDFKVVRDRIIPSTWHDVGQTEIEPRNGTPLNDATARLLALAEAGNYDKVAIIIMTDGEENSSREYTTAETRRRLDVCRSRGWQVIMLGAEFNNVMQAGSYNNNINATATVSAGQMVNSMRGTAMKRAVYGATGQSMGYTAEEKAEFLGKTTSGQ